MNSRLKSLIDFLSTHKLLSSISRGDYYFDEPPLHYIFTDVFLQSPYFKTDKFVVTQSIYGGGSSFFDKSIAFGKALGESTERICQEIFRPSTINHKRFVDIKSDAIDPAIHTADNAVREKKIGWVTGRSLNTGKEAFIPAQYAHYTYTDTVQEESLTALISTGGALGFSKAESLLAGLYELIERDAFMTTYLIKAPVSHIDIDHIQDKQISHISKHLKQYLLEWHLFDITTDLEVPVFLSLLVDRTGVGPALTAGASAHMNPYQAIIHSVTEAVTARPWIRAALTKETKRLTLLKAGILRVRKRLDRALYWYPLDSLPKLDFWLKKQTNVLTKRKKIFSSIQNELKYIISRLGPGYPTYSCEITHPIMKRYNLHVHKVINPYLHGLYLDEEETRCVIDPKRLAQIARYYKMDSYTINPTPHPFL